MSRMALFVGLATLQDAVCRFVGFKLILCLIEFSSLSTPLKVRDIEPGSAIDCPPCDPDDPRQRFRHYSVFADIFKGFN